MGIVDNNPENLDKTRISGLILFKRTFTMAFSGDSIIMNYFFKIVKRRNLIGVSSCKWG